MRATAGERDDKDGVIDLYWPSGGYVGESAVSDARRMADATKHPAARALSYLESCDRLTLSTTQLVACIWITIVKNIYMHVCPTGS